MNNKLKKTLLTAGLATAVMVTSAAQADGNGKGDGTDGNPLMKKSVLPFGAPDFRIIKETDYTISTIDRICTIFQNITFLQC